MLKILGVLHMYVHEILLGVYVHVYVHVILLGVYSIRRKNVAEE